MKDNIFKLTVLLILADITITLQMPVDIPGHTLNFVLLTMLGYTLGNVFFAIVKELWDFMHG